MRLPPPTTPSFFARAGIRPGIWLVSRRALWLGEPPIRVAADRHRGHATVRQHRVSLPPCPGDAPVDATQRGLIAASRRQTMIRPGDTVHAAEGADPARRFLCARVVPDILIAASAAR